MFPHPPRLAMARPQHAAVKHSHLLRNIDSVSWQADSLGFAFQCTMLLNTMQESLQFLGALVMQSMYMGDMQDLGFRLGAGERDSGDPCLAVASKQ